MTGQPAYAWKVLEKMKMSNSKSFRTPIDPGSHILRKTENEEAVKQ